MGWGNGRRWWEIDAVTASKSIALGGQEQQQRKAESPAKALELVKGEGASESGGQQKVTSQSFTHRSKTLALRSTLR